MIADFAPLAALAARGRIPLVHIGNGYTLPPHEMPRFPLLHRYSPPVWYEEQTLATINVKYGGEVGRRWSVSPSSFREMPAWSRPSLVRSLRHAAKQGLDGPISIHRQGEGGRRKLDLRLPVRGLRAAPLDLRGAEAFAGHCASMRGSAGSRARRSSSRGSAYQCRPVPLTDC